MHMPVPFRDEERDPRFAELDRLIQAQTRPQPKSARSAGSQHGQHHKGKAIYVGGIRLTPRQVSLCSAVTQDLRECEIASLFGLTEGTVKVTLSALYSHVGVRSRVGLAVWWLRNTEEPGGAMLGLA